MSFSRRHFIKTLSAGAGACFIAMNTAGCSSDIFPSGSGAEPLWEPETKRSKIVVISDIHLGIDDRYTETLENRPILIKFLQRLQRTTDVRELVIAGDFLDEWFLPVYYPSYTDQDQFYKDVIDNNKSVLTELKNVIDSGIKVVYVPGNHDLTLEEEILQKAIPGLVQARDGRGLGAYYTGDRNEIVIEHGHRYDVFSAPDTLTNAELCGNDETIMPAGYFYARYAATWVLEGRPKVIKTLPVVTNVPDSSDTDQYGAFLYYSVLKDISTRITPFEGLSQKIFDMRISGFNDSYTYLDFYPAQEADGTITAPVLFRHIQRTWAERQVLNNVKVPNSFSESVLGAVKYESFFTRAKANYLENPAENVDIVVFGHTHVPSYRNIGGGKCYLNSGTWIDHNVDHPETPRSFVVITTGETNSSAVYSYGKDGSVVDITAKVSGSDS
ncbi:metallophosphoesterase [Seleniivibrio woodruffii]|uniref:Putative phosphoesterase n=1 Tax=Seleniivibrio woodruffii TaxID=1078050 RepID=A0A4R1KE99_9BACT|nr:metallophosphoesterase [Seleniivibrio woodruffii]TCK62323.1 putative phosphoesterase [Seleniivibrio woodruffii]TVZ34560.1 calcineurin-like phosphoesterase family protein [Seleniivibrio woodruffii]